MGRVPLRYCLEIIPITARDLPATTAGGAPVVAVSVVWDKGAKVSFTDAAPVQQSGAAFNQVMRQDATIYQQGDTLLPKEYRFKVEAVQLPGQPEGRRRTIASARLDLAQFCAPPPAAAPAAAAAAAAHAAAAAATEVQVALQPQGTLSLSIRAVWLQQYEGRADTRHRHAGSSSSTEFGGAASDAGSSADHSECMFDADNDALHSGSAELNRLLQEAEAEHASKCSTPGRASPAAAHILALRSPSGAAGGPGRAPSGSQRSSSSEPMMAGRPPAGPCSSASSTSSGYSGSSYTSSGSSSSSSYSSGGSSSSGQALYGGSCPTHRRRRSIGMPNQPTIMEDGRSDMEASQRQQPHPQHQQEACKLQSKRSADELLLGCDSYTSIGSGDDDDDASSDCETFCPSKFARAHLAASSAGPTAGGVQGCGPEGLRALSGHMPAWLWPSSRLAVRGLTTDEIMRRISGTHDGVRLQHLCRGLLIERNEWRSRAMQAERTQHTLQLDVQRLHAARDGLQQQLAQVQADASMLEQLVEAKLALAQADLAAQGLRQQLTREREQSRATRAALAALQARLDAVVESQQAAAAAPAAAATAARVAATDAA